MNGWTPSAKQGLSPSLYTFDALDGLLQFQLIRRPAHVIGEPQTWDLVRNARSRGYFAMDREVWMTNLAGEIEVILSAASDLVLKFLHDEIQRTKEAMKGPPAPPSDAPSVWERL